MTSISRVPQKGITAFSNSIIPINDIVKKERVYSFLKSSLEWQFEKLELDKTIIESAVRRCLDLAKNADDILKYERDSHAILTQCGILPFFNELTSTRANTMAATISPYLKGSTILDLGCGTGKVSEILSKDNWKLHLADVYQNDYVKNSLSDLSFTQIVMDETLPFPKLSFDNILLFAMLHHTKDPLKILKEVHEILTSSGRLHLIETVFGIKETPLEDSAAKEFSELNSDEQLWSTMFLDYFANHVTWYFTTNPEHLIPVPFNFNTPTKWEGIFRECGFALKEKRHLGIDPNSGVYHILFVMEK